MTSITMCDGKLLQSATGTSKCDNYCKRDVTPAIVENSKACQLKRKYPETFTHEIFLEV